MAALAIFTPSQALLKNQRQLPMGYQYVPTGALTVCGKRKRQPGDPPPARPPPVSTAKQRKVSTQEELAAKEKQQKIALLAKRLELLKAHQQLLLTSPHLVSSVPLATPRVSTKKAKKPSAAAPPSDSRRSGRAVKTPKFPDADDEPPVTPAPKKSSNPYEQQIADLSAHVASLAKHLTAKTTPKAPKNLDVTPLTTREKQTLKVDLSKLPLEKLGPVIQLCSQNSGVEEKSDDSITIDIEKLDIPTLRKLQKYAKKTIGEMNRKKGSKSPATPAMKKVAPSPLLESPPMPQPSPSRPPPTPIPAVLPPAPQRHASSESESDSSSSSDSDSEAEPEKESKMPETPQPYLEPPPMPAFDPAAWSSLAEDSSSSSSAGGAGAAGGGAGDGLWSSFRSKEQEQRNHEAERRQLEEQLAAERAREVEEMRKRAADERSRQDAENLRLQQLREAELDRDEQERENQREAARLARQAAQTVDLGQQSMMMDLMDSFS